MVPDMIQINRIIIHDVPKHLRTEQDGQPVLSQVISPLPGDSREYFQSHLVRDTHSERSFDVIRKADTQSPVPQILERFFTGAMVADDDFIESSQNVARHLYAIQNGQNPGGILAVLDGTSDSGPIFACLKLEREEGLELRPDLVNGRQTFLAEHIKNLVLTEKTRLFKLAVFYQDDAGEILGRVRDSQTGYDSKHDVASFFLRFLGFNFLEQPEVTTRAFYDLTQGFIEHVDGPASDRVKYATHLASEILGNATTIDPIAFAARSFPAPVADQFLSHLSEHGFALRQFTKNAARIENSIKTVVIELAHVQVIGTPDAIENHVTVEDDGAEAVVTIRDRFNSAHTKRRPVRTKRTGT